MKHEIFTKAAEELEKQVEQHQNEAQQSLQKGRNKDAVKKQKQAADEMERFASEEGHHGATLRAMVKKYRK